MRALARLAGIVALPQPGVRALATAAAATAPTAAPTDLLPPRHRRFERRGTRKLPELKPEDCPYVATHVVRRATTVAPPGIKLADITVLGKHLRPDLALGVSARPEAGSAAAADEAAAKAAAQFESTTSSGPSSSSDSAGSASEGEGVAGSSHRAPADAGDALGSSSASSPAPPASAPAGATRAFAVISLGGTQYKVTPGDIINAERIPGAEVGSTLTITAVHAVGTASTTVLGRPTVPGAAVRLTVEECCLDRKVIVFKKRRRKRYQRTAGHRRMVTRLRVEEVHADPSHFA